MPSTSRTRSAPRRPAFRPGLEALEGRALLSATQLKITAAPAATAGDDVVVTVAALDASSQPAADYTGTVSFSSSDEAAVLPPEYTFTVADGGRTRSPSAW